MVSFVMVVRHVLTDRASQVALAERDQPTQAFELDGPNEPLCMRVAVWSADGRLDDLDTGGAQKREHWAAPFAIAIANQHRARVETTVDVVGQMAHRNPELIERSDIISQADGEWGSDSACPFSRTA